jgi:serpin B
MTTILIKNIGLSFIPIFLMAFGWPLMAASSKSETSTVAQADNQFALDLYGQLDREKPGENLFFSPTSISMALSMTAAGAKNQTEAEMAQVLHLTGILPQAHAEYHKLLQRWNADNKDRGYQLRVANRLWGQKNYTFLDSYLTLTRQEYGAELGIVDFVGQTEAVRKEINAWVEKQTAEKIKDLIPEGVLDGMTRLVLTNAIYFKGDWVCQFQKELTRDEDFTVSAGQKVKTPLMQQKRKYPYMEDASLQALELPYKGEELSMLVLLPKKPDGLAELEKSLSALKIDELRSKLSSREVIVFLPKFKLETSFSLNKTLGALGMKAAFSPGEADFSGMDGQTGRDGLYISTIIHKAFVDVNEQGTEAAAATGVVMAPRAMPILTPPAIFRADHPFVFMICDKRDGSILFLGRLAVPKA